MTLIEVHTLFSTDEKCREILSRLRWPNGPECPRCKTTEIVRLGTHKELYWCRECDYQFSVTVGTIFNDSHLALSKWFVAAYLICESRKGISANQIKRILGVSYKTAWYLCHRIRAAMADRERKLFGGIVEVDETYIGGKKPQRYGKKNPGGRSHDKDIVVGFRQRGGDVRYIKANDVSAATLYKLIQENVSQDVDLIMTDEFAAYPRAMGSAFKDRHRTIRHKVKYVDGIIHTNSAENAFSLLKRGIVGTWHRVSAKHLPAYLEEMTFRFNRRNSSDLFLDTLRHMVTADPLTFERLTA